MPSYNKVILIGNLTQDPELRYTSGGTAVGSLTLAVNRKYIQNNEPKEEVCFVNITVWGKQAESANEYLSKGNPVLIEGHLRQNKWETEDGQKRSRLEVTAEQVKFLPKTKKEGD